MTEDVLSKNLELWSHFYPQEAVKMAYFDISEYKIKDGHLFGPKGAYEPQNVDKWFKEINLNQETVLLVYGVGLGEIFKPIEAWLKEDKKRKVFFFEEDPSVLYSLFTTSLATKMLKNPQVEIHLLRGVTDEDPAIEKFFWSAAQNLSAVTALPAYQTWYPERFSEFEHMIVQSLDLKNGLIDEYLSLGASFFRSFYFNILDLPDSFLGNKLFGKFKGVPAIICGAGPSLEKQITQLEKLKDKALIFSGGSSLNALSYAGIQPHFGCGLDPNNEQAIRLSTNNSKGLPFFYRNRMFVGAFRKISGPRLYITGSGGYDISDYYENRLGIESEFIDEGHNVVNFLCEITTRLGCSPIIFVGLDLAYTDFKTYSKGVVGKYELTEKTLPKEAILKEDIDGNPIWTEWKWISERKWIENFIKEHPKSKMINCTEGGLGIEGIETLPLSEATEKYLKKDYNLTPKLMKAFREAKKKSITRPKIRKLTRDLQVSLLKSIDLLETIENDAKYRLKHDPESPPSAESAMAEHEILEEIGYVFVLDIFNKVFSNLQNHRLRALKMKKDRTKSSIIEKKKLVLQQERITFLKRVANLNIKIINLALSEKYTRDNRSGLPYLENTPLKPAKKKTKVNTQKSL